MFLREEALSGAFEGVDRKIEFSLCTNVGGGDWILRLGERQFVFSAAEFVKQVFGQVFEPTTEEKPITAVQAVARQL